MSLTLFIAHAGVHDLVHAAAEPGRLQALARPWRSADSTKQGALAAPALLDLSDSWDVLHGLLAGSPWDGSAPAATLLAGGSEIGRDTGGGRARLATTEETAAFARYLFPLCPIRLKRDVDPRRAARTRFYAAADAHCPGRHALQERVEHDLPRLKRHVSTAADRGHGLLMWMM